MADDPLVIPVPGEAGDSGISTGKPVGECTMNENDYGMLKMRLLEHGTAAHARRNDGADHYAENLRYDYLEGKQNVSLTEALGPRYLQGPHPQYGSPDGK